MKILNLISILSLLIFLTACDEDKDDQPSPDNPEATNESTFSADGTTYNFKTAGPINNANGFFVVFRESINSFPIISFSMSNTLVADSTYILPTTPIAIDFSTAANEAYFINSGQITFTKADFMNNEFEATFTAEFENQASTDTIQITNGSFYYKE